jgi:F0F1-type ATP synthase epsilon subunit
LAPDDEEFHFTPTTATARFLENCAPSVPLLSGEVAWVVVPANAGRAGVLVVVGEEIAVESDGGADGVDVACGGLVEGAGSMMTVLVEGAVRPVWSVTT